MQPQAIQSNDLHPLVEVALRAPGAAVSIMEAGRHILAQGRKRRRRHNPASVALAFDIHDHGRYVGVGRGEKRNEKTNRLLASKRGHSGFDEIVDEMSSTVKRLRPNALTYAPGAHSKKLTQAIAKQTGLPLYLATSPKLAGAHVVVIDDVFTTGRTMKRTAAQIKQPRKVSGVVYLRAMKSAGTQIQPNPPDRFTAFKTKPGVIRLFKLGDFYEAFDQDAETIGKALTITATSTRGAQPRRLAGVPAHAVDRYVAQLRAQGYAVELVESNPLPLDEWDIDEDAAFMEGAKVARALGGSVRAARSQARAAEERHAKQWQVSFASKKWRRPYTIAFPITAHTRSAAIAHGKSLQSGDPKDLVNWTAIRVNPNPRATVLGYQVAEYTEFGLLKVRDTFRIPGFAPVLEKISGTEARSLHSPGQVKVMLMNDSVIKTTRGGVEKNSSGDNLSCPRCGHYNALLFDRMNDDDSYRLKCRDCGFTANVPGDEGDRKTLEAIVRQSFLRAGAMKKRNSAGVEKNTGEYDKPGDMQATNVELTVWRKDGSVFLHQWYMSNEWPKAHRVGEQNAKTIGGHYQVDVHDVEANGIGRGQGGSNKPRYGLFIDDKLAVVYRSKRAADQAAKYYGRAIPSQRYSVARLLKGTRIEGVPRHSNPDDPGWSGRMKAAYDQGHEDGYAGKPMKANSARRDMDTRDMYRQGYRVGEHLRKQKQLERGSNVLEFRGKRNPRVSCPRCGYSKAYYAREFKGGAGKPSTDLVCQDCGLAFSTIGGAKGMAKREAQRREAEREAIAQKYGASINPLTPAPEHLKRARRDMSKFVTQAERAYKKMAEARERGDEKAAARNPAKRSNPAALDRFSKMFHGKANGAKRSVIVSHHVPNALARIGELPYIKMHTRPVKHNNPAHACGQCAILFSQPPTFRTNGSAFVAATANKRLALGGPGVESVGKQLRAQIEGINPNARGREINLGKIEVLAYITPEKHSNSGRVILYHHSHGEDSGRVRDMPSLCIDRNGMLYIPSQSGRYTIDDRGIIN